MIKIATELIGWCVAYHHVPTAKPHGLTRRANAGFLLFIEGKIFQGEAA